MKTKKIIAIMSVISIVFIGGRSTVYASENSNDNTIPQKVIDISDGSDEIYGNGVPLDHTENPNSRFVSGGVNHTHQYILSNAVKILYNDKGNSIFSESIHLENLLYFTDWPDEYGNETDLGTFSGHFYNPKTGKNWMGQTSPTAMERAMSYFKEAVSAYNNGKVASAIKYIGIGSHYISDLSVPHHTSDLTAINSNHTEFEKYVDTNRATFKIVGNSLNDSYYTKAETTSIYDLIQSIAVYSNSLSSEAQNKNTYFSAAKKSVESGIINVTQYFYMFGKAVGIY